MVESHKFTQLQYSNILELLKAEEEYRKIVIPREEEVASYYTLRTQLTALAKEFKAYVTKPKYIIPFLQPGRMIHVIIQAKLLIITLCIIFTCNSCNCA